MRIDAKGNLIVVGSTNQVLNNSIGAITTITKRNTSNDGFILKYNSSGGLIGQIELGGITNATGDTLFNSVVIGESNSIYVGGNSSVAFSSNGSTNTLTKVSPATYRDGIILRFNESLVYQNGLEYGSTQAANTVISQITNDGAFNIYATGYSGGSLTNSTLYTMSKTSNLGVDSSYILKYTKTITLPSTGSFGRVFNTNSVTSSNQLNDILVDSSSSIYAVGRTFAKLDNVNNSLQKINATTFSDGFLLRYIYQTNTYVESGSIEFGGATPNQNYNTTAMELTSNSNNQVYYSGWTNISLIRANTFGNFAYVRTYTNPINTYEYADNFTQPTVLQYNKLGNTFYNFIIGGGSYSKLGESKINSGYDGFISWVK
jgi:hypothetical protein